jgi:hypothetical protein
MNLHDDYLPILLKEEKLGRLEESQPFSPPVESPENEVKIGDVDVIFSTREERSARMY